MKYAIIQLSGKQFKVQEGDVLDTPKLPYKEGEKVSVDEVLLVVDGKKQTIGTPFVKGAKVDLEVMEHAKEKKIRVATYRAKSRSRKVYGHKQPKSVVKVVKIHA